MTHRTIIAMAVVGLSWSSGCGYVGQVKQAADRIEEMRPEIEQRNKEVESLANPTAAPVDPSTPAP
jgi:hypothetical protein